MVKPLPADVQGCPVSLSLARARDLSTSGKVLARALNLALASNIPNPLVGPMARPLLIWEGLHVLSKLEIA